MSAKLAMGTTMTPEQINLVRESWRQLDSAKLSCIFYKTLFEDNPMVEEMFLNSIEQQQKKFSATLSFIVSHLDELGNLLPMVRELGVQHAGYGVIDEHYVQVETALLLALQHPQFGVDGETLEAWETAYNAVAEVMQQAVTDSFLRL